MFNWKAATIEEMAKHIASIPPQQVTSLLHYYRKHNNIEMLTVIKEARILAKRYRAASKVASLIEEHGLKGVEYVTELTKPIDAMGT